MSTGELKYFTGYPQLGQDHDVRSDRPTGRSDKIMKNRPSGDFIHILITFPQNHPKRVRIFMIPAKSSLPAIWRHFAGIHYLQNFANVLIRRNRAGTVACRRTVKFYSEL